MATLFDMQQPGQILRELRVDRKMTLGQVAYLSGHNKSTISRWENGKLPIDLHIYIGLLKLVGAKLVVMEIEEGDRT